jgi:polyribonucleotide nucleotidyltransferase
MNIDPSKIGTVIGPGGKVIRSIIEQTKTSVDIDNGGTVLIGSTDEEAAQKAIKMIEDLTKEVEVGAIYTGKVTRIFNYGALVEVLPGKEGLVHISELADYRVPSVEDVIKLGDEVMVKVIEIDRQGKISLSRRAVFQSESNESGEARARNSSGHGYDKRPHSTRPYPQHGGRKRDN